MADSDGSAAALQQEMAALVDSALAERGREEATAETAAAERPASPTAALQQPADQGSVTEGGKAAASQAGPSSRASAPCSPAALGSESQAGGKSQAGGQPAASRGAGTTKVAEAEACSRSPKAQGATQSAAQSRVGARGKPAWALSPQQVRNTGPVRIHVPAASHREAVSAQSTLAAAAVPVVMVWKVSLFTPHHALSPAF